MGLPGAEAGRAYWGLARRLNHPYNGRDMEEPKILNREAMLRMEAIKAGLAGRLLDAFLGHAPGRYASYSEGIASGDWSAVEAAAHSLKSSSGQLGADRLLGLCDRMERAAENGDAESVRAMDAEFRSVYAGTIDALREERTRWPASGG